MTKLDALPATFKEFRSALTYAGKPKGGPTEARNGVLGTRTPERPVPARPAALTAP